MGTREFIFKHGSKEIVLPVTPSSYELEEGINVEIINLHEFGDYPAAGYQTSNPIPISCLLPNNDYSFATDWESDPYIEQLRKWMKAQTRVRFIVSGTKTNIPVIIENMRYGEDDGTTDITLHLTLRPKPALEPIVIQQTKAATKPRAAKEEQAGLSNYTVVAGDTLSAICWRFYGNATPTYWNKLAEYNGISNPHLIFPGNVLKIPKPLL